MHLKNTIKLYFQDTAYSLITDSMKVLNKDTSFHAIKTICIEGMMQSRPAMNAMVRKVS